ncbi:hypothetical protein [Iningainema tapete]|uniref:Uncharacterized protein n=1 Tax=Iningainema tapete BLCC-T55 TaxID=2748662 RepID=A0A8J6XIY0_9CYAN|nr:hypothetical protein [Iningainema tapete]MBD2776844.1 hypothetical protein [Iningainema tapete BLCC-T55]
MIKVKKLTYFWLLLGLSLLWVTVSYGWTNQGVKSWAGKLTGSRHWQLPDTANGLKPTQSWHATGSAPNGDIYIGGMDHFTNSALYRLEPGKNTLRYVGDARSASLAASNWKSGETAQKFHTRPHWYQGKVYVATMDRSDLNDEYLSSRGFHWYAYDPIQDKFSDLSVSEPDGVGAKHVSIVTIASDPKLNVLYGAAVPTADIYKYDVAKGRTENLGRPAAYDQKYPYTGRLMWVDSRSRLYFSTGNLSWGGYDQSIYGHIYYYDPKSGFGEMKNWKLQEPRAIELGQCLPHRQQCFFSDDRARIYRFDDNGPSWFYVGQAKTVPAEIFSLNVSADGKKAYFVTSSLGPIPPDPKNPNLIYEFDLITKSTRKLCSLAELDPQLANFNANTGYDTWDNNGRFYFSSFSRAEETLQKRNQNVIVTQIDPVRLKVRLGLLPSLTEVSVHKSPEPAKPGFVFTRIGSMAIAQEVLYKLTVTKTNGSMQERYGKTTIPAKIASITVPLQQLQAVTPNTIKGGVLSVIPNGNDYVVGAKQSIAF